jgi:hypothetical protein
MRFGQWRPLAETWNRQPLLTTPDIICLHTMVGTLAGTDAQFRTAGYGGTFSHFGVGGDGTAYQWQDTRYRAAANLDGNHRIVSVETADRGTPFPPWDVNDGSAVPAWTDEQVTRLAALVAALCEAHDIPCALIPDSRPGRRGVGYHRQGCDGSYPDGRVPGGELWSSARGKTCPGNRRIAQIPVVIGRARSILAGGSVPAPAPTPPLGGDVQLSDRLPDLYTGNPADTMTVGDTLAWAAAHAAIARDSARAAERAAVQAGAAAMRVEAAVAQLLARPVSPLDPGAIRAAVAEALGGGLDITGTATPKGKTP